MCYVAFNGHTNRLLMALTDHTLFDSLHVSLLPLFNFSFILQINLPPYIYTFQHNLPFLSKVRVGFCSKYLKS